MTKHEVERDFLTEEELQAIVSSNFGTGRLNHVRDIFVFRCFTGLAYADVQKLKWSEVARRIDGDYWIFTSRAENRDCLPYPSFADSSGHTGKVQGLPCLCEFWQSPTSVE